MPERKTLYKTLPSNAIVAEIGVYDGANAAVILNNAFPKKLYLIDPWISTDNYQDFSTDQLIEAEKRTRHMVKDYTDTAAQRILAAPGDIEHYADITIIKDFSTSASKQFKDHYFDWIYIDGSHEYEDVKADLAYWIPKVKKGGYICGHDFSLDDNWKWEGVHGAVCEFIVKYVEKKPEIIEEAQARHLRRRYNRSAIHRCGHSYECPRLLHCGRIVELINPNGNYWFQSITPPEIIEIVLKWIDHFPGQPRSFKLQVGDWADDLNYKEIIEDSKQTR